MQREFNRNIQISPHICLVIILITIIRDQPRSLIIYMEKNYQYTKKMIPIKFCKNL